MLKKDFIDPAEVFDEIELDNYMTGADFGAGSGHWSLELARRLNEGVVYAIDISGASLSALKSRRKSAHLPNLKILQRDLSGGLHSSRLPANSVDIVLLVNVLFQIEDEEALAKEAQRVLKEDGQILIVDWTQPLRGMPDYFSPAQTKKLAQKLGWTLEKEFKAGEYHKVLIYTNSL